MSEPREPLTPEHVQRVIRCVQGMPHSPRRRPDEVDLYIDAERLGLEWLEQRQQLDRLNAILADKFPEEGGPTGDVVAMLLDRLWRWEH